MFAAGLALALAVLLRSTGDGEPQRSERPRAPAAGIPTQPLTYPALGLRVGRPPGWRARRRGPLVRLTSPEGGAVVAISAAPQGTPPRRLRRAAERAILDGYPGARVLRRSRASLGGIRGPASALAAPARGGAADVAIVAVAADKRSYAATAISSRKAPGPRAREVAAVLASLHFIER